MTMKIPEAVECIISRLNENGYEAFAVGGCVRDTILCRSPEDWDITTSAKPEQVKEIFPRTVDTGIQHGTVTVIMNRTGYEVTTYRIDGEYEDGRHPKSVSYTSVLKEDLRRRDFTINAMAYSHKTGIVDEFKGMDDLKKQVIRCVGDPIERFIEDALRILRAIRFSAQLNFTIEAQTFKAITVIAPNMAKVSKERIQTELTKLLISSHPEKISLVYETGISPYISSHFHQVPYEKAVKLNGRENGFLPEGKKYLRWAMFLRFAGEEQAVLVLKDLKMDNDTICKARTLVKWWDYPVKAEEESVRLLMSKMEPELFDDLLQLKMLSAYGRQITDYCKEIALIRDLIRDRGDCLYLRDLSVTGKDLIEAGIKPGKEIGDILEKMLSAVLQQPKRNTKEELLNKFVYNKAPAAE
ncbi:MAG: CCA tRNA nucleotidyltransferase [Lachnoclostridium edouardi]|uniref:CCA tRNA nucleotidyltransferase n=1 Tax=Lachnoclostridium edouardi TaxID=1926283 RepID=UPI0026DBA193|nr:CCA tRNA nucleotidyltransferase [Lachnoclostridium edouardi]MDO4279088.1 CCA tRNA nucleotidyltransferase [Lachnoclostridium edouardi]